MTTESQSIRTLCGLTKCSRDKPHRCPNCWNIPNPLWESPRSPIYRWWLRWKIQRCDRNCKDLDLVTRWWRGWSGWDV